MATRVAKHWGGPNPRFNITEFNLDEVNKDNLVNEILVMNQHDVSGESVMSLFGSFNGGKAFCHHYDTFEVPVGAFKFIDDNGKERSNSTSFITTFGIWIFNIFLLQGFGFSKIFGGYVNDNIDKKKFGKMHQKIIYALMEDRIDTESYKNFIIYTDFIMPWETIFAPAQSEKLITCTKEINKMKNKLIKENQEAVDRGDPAVVEKIQDELIDWVKEYFKDDSALDAYLSGAGGSLGNNFKNMYIMKGVIRDPDPNAKQRYHTATSSFIDGISSDEYALLANSLAAGPYSRSKKTETGGYWEKLMEQAMNTVIIDGKDTDCGTDKALEVTLTPDIIDMFVYSYIVKPNGELEELTSDKIDKYLNKKVKVRTTLFCKSKTGGVCHHCAGNFFYRRGSDRIGLACSAVPTKLKLVSMKSFHDSTVNTTEINAIKAFSL